MDGTLTNFYDVVYREQENAPGNPSDGRLNVIWNDPNLTGVTLSPDAIAFELCFTVEVATATPLTFFNPTTTLRAFDDQ